MSRFDLQFRPHSGASSIVAGGYGRMVEGFVAEARLEVEKEFAAQLNEFGLLGRWRIRRKITRETARRVAERCQHVSPDSLF